LENGRVCSDLFGVDVQQMDRVVVGECVGCKEDIFEGEESVNFNDDLLHDEDRCLAAYVRKGGFIGIATKEK